LIESLQGSVLDEKTAQRLARDEIDIESKCDEISKKWLGRE
jgi:hypothetical protein